MLLSLNIRNVVLIEQLNISFPKGLTVFTGETGAGKSILLDSLSLALGSKMDIGLIRKGSQQASVTAEFAVPQEEEFLDFLSEHGIDYTEGSLFLRRIIKADGKSKAFINDDAVSVSFLRQVGEYLIEIQGQFSSSGLLDSSKHIDILDSYGDLGDKVKLCKQSFAKWKQAEKLLTEAKEESLRLSSEEEYLRHIYEELEEASPRLGEEEELIKRRSILMNAEKISENLNTLLQALQGSGGSISNLRIAEKSVEHLLKLSDGDNLIKISECLNRVSLEFDEALNLIDKIKGDLFFDVKDLDIIEERLFKIRDLARKHKVTVEALPSFKDSLLERINKIEDSEERISLLEERVRTSKIEYEHLAKDLSLSRIKVGKILDEGVNKELPSLKLDKARFTSKIEPLPENLWNSNGIDKVSFLVSTNKGIDEGFLSKISSGGELSRFLLAIKLNLVRDNSISTLIFDEIDSGIGGATATAIGERLSKLSKICQVIVITHSPQVASFGDYHLFVSKETKIGDITKSKVVELTGSRRKEEIARMLSGAKITDEARAAAQVLLESSWKKQEE